MGEREEGDTGEGHVGDAAVLRAAGAGLALVARFLAGLDQLLGPHGHEPWRWSEKPQLVGEIEAQARSPWAR